MFFAPITFCTCCDDVLLQLLGFWRWDDFCCFKLLLLLLEVLTAADDETVELLRRPLDCLW